MQNLKHNNGTHFTVYEQDGYVTIVEESERTNTPTIIISWKAVLFIIITFIGIYNICIKVPNQKRQDGQSKTIYSIEDSQTNASYSTNNQNLFSEENSSFYKTGIVFPDSSSRILSTEEIVSLGYDYEYSEEKMLEYAINEIYARNGYDFKTDKWENYYTKYGWYYNLGFSDNEARERFNDNEKENMKKLEQRRFKVRGY